MSSIKAKQDRIDTIAGHMGWPDWKVQEEVDCGCKFTAVAGGRAIRYRQGRYAEFGSCGFSIFRTKINGRNYWKTSAGAATFQSIDEAADYCAYMRARRG